MDRFTYEQLRVKRPELALPYWHRLRRVDRHRLKRMSIDQLIAGRVWRFISSGGQDALQPYIGLRGLSGVEKWEKIHASRGFADRLQPVKPANRAIAWIHSHSTPSEPANFYEWSQWSEGKRQ